MSSLKELYLALSFFEEDWLLSTDLQSCAAGLKRVIDDQKINILRLRGEYDEVMAQNAEVDWYSIAMSTKLFSEPRLYSVSEIKNIVELYLDEQLYPEHKLNVEELYDLKKFIIELLTKQKENNGWMPIEELLKRVKIINKNIKPYHFYNSENYFEIDFQIQVENPDKLWVIDQLRIRKETVSKSVSKRKGNKNL